MTTAPTAPVDLTPLVRTFGRSMLPLIKNRSLVRYLPATAEEVAVGDIIVFRLAGKLHAHRLIAKRSEGGRTLLRQKGDHELCGSWVETEALVGKAVSVSRGSETCRLNVNPRSLRLLLLTAYARLESGIVTAYVRLKSGRRWLAWIKAPALLLAVAAAPFRWLLVRLLLTVYRRQRRTEDPADLAFLLACFRSVHDAPGGKEPLPPVADWNTLIETLGVNRLAPLALKLLSEDETRGTAPPHALQALKQIRYRAALSHMSALAALGDIDRLFQAAGVGYAVLKGPYLYESLYGGLFPREYEDIDLLVRPAAVDKALSLLWSAGYEPVGGTWARSLMRRGHFHLTLHSTAPGRPPVELHWALVDRANLYRIDEVDILLRARPFHAGDRKFFALSAEDQFIYLCLHAAKHGVLNGIGLAQGCPPEWFCRRTTGNDLTWFMDLDLFLQNEMAGFSWTRLVEKTRDWNVMAPLVECLCVLRLLQPASAAGAALEKLGYFDPAPGTAPETVSLSARFLKSPAAQKVVESSMRMSPAFFFRPVRLLLAARLLFPSREELLQYYGSRDRRGLVKLRLTHPFHMLRKIFGRPAGRREPSSPPAAAQAQRRPGSTIRTRGG